MEICSGDKQSGAKLSPLVLIDTYKRNPYIPKTFDDRTGKTRLRLLQDREKETA